MPYIRDEERAEAGSLRTVGMLNYEITGLIVSYLRAHGQRYQTINDVVGVLECAKLELYRRVAAPYEDQKMTENGDVY